MSRQFLILDHQASHWLFLLLLPLLAVSNSANAHTDPMADTVPVKSTESDVQPEQMMTPVTPQACLALDSSVERLSCYDTALGREPLQASEVSPVAAQPEASHITATIPVSKLELATDLLTELNPFNAQHTVPEHPDLSLLDRRWELSEQSKLGTLISEPIALYTCYQRCIPHASMSCRPAQILSIKHKNYNR